MKTTSKLPILWIVQLAYKAGLRKMVISPGSRNAPLTIAMNQHPGIDCVVVPDERVAAFVALGMAQQLDGQLVGILCTSGSAPLNYYPAITEAYYQRVPLLVFTADRPSAWTNQGDGQTIMQQNVFSSHVNASLHLEDKPETKEYLWYVKRELSALLNKAIQPSKGPVHINVSLSEPLYEQKELDVLPEVEPISFLPIKQQLQANELDRCVSTFSTSKKVMILCGQMAKNERLNKVLVQLSTLPNVAVLVEHTSNLQSSNFIQCIDRTLSALTDEMEAQYAPDLLIYIGNAIISKKIKAYLRRFPASIHWKIGLDFPEMDTFQQLSQSIQMEPSLFFEELEKRIDFFEKRDTQFAAKWKSLDYKMVDKASEIFKELPFSDLSVMERLMDSIPENVHVHFSNSAVVRYGLLMNPVSSHTYWCNRGTSGIDGSTSTAVGAAFANPDKLHVLFTGDMSFFYDSNAFWQHLPLANLRVFLIHNGGGSIFKIIPGPDQTEELEDFFVFNNSFEAKSICETFRVSHQYIRSFEELDNVLPAFFSKDDSSKPKLLEIVTTNIPNEAILKNYFKQLREEV